jgi:hypothetical protein
MPEEEFTGVRNQIKNLYFYKKKYNGSTYEEDLRLCGK